jgi:hypothetical protein
VQKIKVKYKETENEQLRERMVEIERNHQNRKDTSELSK